MDIMLTSRIVDAEQALAQFKERMSVSSDEPFSVALRNDQLAFDRIAATDEAKAAIARFAERESAR